MKKLIIISILAALFFGNIFSAKAQCSNSHAKKASYKHHDKKQDVVDIAINSKDFSTLGAAVKAADLVNTLKDDGPFTVFAPTNGAFNKIPTETLNSLLQPANKSILTKILTYHVVAGRLDAIDVIDAVKAGNGKASVKTVSGNTLIARINNGEVILEDEKGNFSRVTKTDLTATNGVVHVIDTVIMPK